MNAGDGKESVMASPAPASHPVSETLFTLAQRASTFSIILSIALIGLGFLAVMVPMASSFGVLVALSWLLMIGGVVQFVHAFRSKGIGDTMWKILVAALYFVTGMYLRANPGVGLMTLTLVLCGFFVAEGLMDIVAYFKTRKMGASGWVLFDGIVTLFLGLLIWRHWPSSSLFVVGTLVGISMIMTGLTRLMLTLAARRAIKVASIEFPKAA